MKTEMRQQTRRAWPVTRLERLARVEFGRLALDEADIAEARLGSDALLRRGWERDPNRYGVYVFAARRSP